MDFSLTAWNEKQVSQLDDLWDISTWESLAFILLMSIRWYISEKDFWTKCFTDMEFWMRFYVTLWKIYCWFEVSIILCGDIFHVWAAGK